MIYAYLLVAIALEVIATSALKATEGFTRLWPSLVTLVGYGISFYFLSLTLRTIRSASSMASGRGRASCSSRRSAGSITAKASIRRR